MGGAPSVPLLSGQSAGGQSTGHLQAGIAPGRRLQAGIAPDFPRVRADVLQPKEQVLGRGTPDATLSSHSDLKAPDLLGFGCLPHPSRCKFCTVQKNGRCIFLGKEEEEEKKKRPPLLIYGHVTLGAETARLLVYASCVAGMRCERYNCKIKVDIL